jgi:2'-5' RNA ligase
MNKPELETAFIIPCPEAEAAVGQIREKYDASAAAGVPAHITILYPFMPPENIIPATMHELFAILGPAKSFAYRLDSIRRFDDRVLYLAPALPAPFARLTRTLHKAFPDYPPYRGQFEEIIPHLTVAELPEPSPDTLAELEARLAPHLPIMATATEILLMAGKTRDIKWRTWHRFTLN